MRPSDIVVRQAGPEDDRALCELFARVTMEGDLVLAVERDPSFFQLYDQQRLTAKRVFVAEIDGRLEGVATFLARQGWLEGSLQSVGYLGDLRLSEKLRGGFFFGRRFGEGLRDCFTSAGAEVATTAIIGSNQAAIRFLTRRSKRFPDKPVYRPGARSTSRTCTSRGAASRAARTSRSGAPPRPTCRASPRASPRTTASGPSAIPSTRACCASASTAGPA